MSEIFLSRYLLKERIGQGGMGSVYRAFDKELQRHVAIKVLPAGGVDLQSSLERFRREARAASALSHPNICTVFDFGEQDGSPFIVMELLEGRSLASLLQEDRLPVSQVISIAIRLCDALAAAHDRGIVHRDIKPGNIMLASSGVPKILDFGVAKLADSDETLQGQTSLTEAGGLVGTLKYLSPEQALGKPVDGRSDLFSLGIVLYEMLSGEHPFEGDSEIARVSAILNQRPAPLSQRVPSVPRDLDRLVLQLLAKDPAQRPATAGEVVRRLTAIQDGGGAGIGQTGRRKASLVVLPLVVVILFLLWLWKGLAPPVADRSLALLPLSYSGPSRLQPNATMLPALLAESLRSSPDLEVAPFESSRLYAADSEPEKTLQELRVAWLLQGTMRVTEPLYSLQLRLEGPGQLTLWTQDYRGEVSEFFGQAAQISSDIARALGESQISSSGLLGADREAVERYLEGKRFLDGWDVESNHERAREAFLSALRVDSDFGEAHAGLALSLWRAWEETGDRSLVEEAQTSAARAVEISPFNPEAHLANGIIQLGRGLTEEAVGSFETAQRLAPADDVVCRHIADAEARLGRTTEAEVMYRRAVSLRPDLWQNHRALGNFLLGQGRFEEAKEPYRHIIRLRPQSDIGHNNLALAHLSLGQFDEAEVHLLAALAIQPNMAGYTNLGFVYYSTGRFQQAAAQFIEATRFAQDETPWLNLGDAYRQLGEAENAAKAYQQSIRLSRSRLQVDPEDAELRIRLGYSLAGAGDCDTAITELNSARSSPSESPWIDYYSAVSFAICGRDEQAERALLEAIQGGLRADVETNPDLRRLLDSPEVRRALR